MAQNSIYNKALDAYNVPKDVYNAIKNAAARTGVNFSYLMEKAAVESSFDTNAKAKTSSATGLFQFIDSTWLKMVKDHGADYGLGKYADKIDNNGHVASSKDKKEILNLRKNPEISSIMAAEFDQANYNQLKENVGGEIGSTELYMAHFLGAGGASGFLNAMKKSPDMAAADVFPREARANRAVFYDNKTGAPRSLSEVYAYFDNKFNDGATGGQTVMTASNGNDLRASSYNGPRVAQAAAITTNDDDSFTRLATLMNGGNTIRAMNFSADRDNHSILRMADASSSSNSNGWQIFPPSLYSRLSLSPAQQMMLSDFNS